MLLIMRSVDLMASLIFSGFAASSCRKACRKKILLPFRLQTKNMRATEKKLRRTLSRWTLDKQSHFVWLDRIESLIVTRSAASVMLGFANFLGLEAT